MLGLKKNVSGCFNLPGFISTTTLFFVLIPNCTSTKCAGYAPFFGFSLMPAESSCKKYTMCFRGELSIELSCPPKSAFDPELRTCTYAAFDLCEAQESLPPVQTQVTCSSTEEEVFYPDYSLGCPDSRYFRCKNGILSALTCPDGLVFDEGTDECMSRENVPCANDGPLCTRPSGVYANYSSGCPAKEFYICMGEGDFISLSCPDGLYYSGTLKNCDYATNIVCGVNVPSW